MSETDPGLRQDTVARVMRLLVWLSMCAGALALPAPGPAVAD
jgi:hypothetical protein